MTKEKVLKAANLSNPAARFIVTDYYRTQEARKRADMQLRHLGELAAGELDAHLHYIGDTHAVLEQQIQRELKAYASHTPVGQWMLAQKGCGPVIAAGMLAHLDITVAPTAGHFWSFSGLNPEKRQWSAGEKRPFCAAMRQLCYHFGECVKRVSGHPDAIYGHLYKSRKELLVHRNDNLEFAERAKIYKTNSADVRATLKEGKLPAGNLDRQAANFAAKIFLSHLHAVMYWDHYKKPPPKPFAIAILGHAHEIKIPNLEMFPGFEQAYYGGVVTSSIEAA
jgi:hypothetical protein